MAVNAPAVLLSGSSMRFRNSFGKRDPAARGRERRPIEDRLRYLAIVAQAGCQEKKTKKPCEFGVCPAKQEVACRT
jgi:hypothetical protein